MTGTPPDLQQPDETMAAVAGVSLRLLAGAVTKRTMEQLKRTVDQSPAEYPWQVVTQVVLSEPVEPQRLVQQGLQAQRDWIVRGGRETPSRPLTQQAKGLVAKVVAQMVFLGVYTAVVVVALLALKYRFPGVDIYRVLGWLSSAFGK